ncbi:ABC transporter ATP-binding protein [Lichenibacterium ramalinae]|uniref:ABC transporter ATP-binding protein n=1 Tax=Lichenibacterium ramalinae TaxID=2316527 RepID=A0A4Q2R7K5_9HYPH|nr:ABC transporter ATP-binding protein [Lichenibacterium ramalinae]RYB01474.1 ABC transporter ATP-binding protein [Lichenibacterium ramalinae]
MSEPRLTATPKLRVSGLGKSYGSTPALKPTDLDVPKGEFLTLLGPSGSGKTTLLQMICGLTEPTTGRVFIDDVDQTYTPVHRRDLGLVFQHYGLFPHLTVAENIAFPLKMRGQAPTDLARQVTTALDMVQMGSLGTRFPRELSGGQQQRVALARCFVYRPSVILMDEPLGALDKKLREHMQLEIKRLHRETGATVVYVTHDQEEALAMSDRICLMNHAAVEQVGTPQDIYARPRTAFAADFIGLSNIFRGRVTRASDGSAMLDTPQGLLCMDGLEGPASGTAALVVRPEQIAIGGDGQNSVAGTVAEMIYAGSETRMIVALRAGERAIVRLRPGLRVPDLGEAVAIGWRTADAVVIP